jgi:hypothetical protein
MTDPCIAPARAQAEPTPWRALAIGAEHVGNETFSLKELLVKSALNRLSFGSSSESSLIFNMSIRHFQPAVHSGD